MASIAQQYLEKRRRVKKQAWLVTGLILAGLVVGGVGAVAFWRSGSPMVAALPASGPEAKVRAWIRNDLRENSDDGNTAWEEVRWFPYEKQGHWGRMRVKYRTGQGLLKRLNDEWFIFDERTGEIVENLALHLVPDRIGDTWYQREFWGTGEWKERFESANADQPDLSRYFSDEASDSDEPEASEEQSGE